MASRVHPNAVISPEAIIHDEVEVGPFVVIEGKVTVGAGTVIRPFVHLIGPMTIGEHNDIGTGTVLGGRPQHLGYRDEATSTIIGNHNVFREHVTVHRGTPAGTGVTVIGDHNYLMAGSHVAHDCEVGNKCLLINHACLGGHVQMSDRSMVSGNSAVHQWCRIGRFALVSGTTSVTLDVPPFIMVNGVSSVIGVNLIGMRRGGFTQQQISGVRAAFKILYRDQNPMNVAYEKLETQLGHIDTVQEMIAFMRNSKRGVCRIYRGSRDDSAMAA